MNNVKTFLTVFLVLIMLFLTACGSKTPDNSDPDSSSSPSADSGVRLQLLYCSKDTLNPFNTKNKSNFELSGLIYEPLVALSDKFEPSYILAEQIKTENNICTVLIRDARFSDNSPVTADDIVNSYFLAKASALYSHLFYEVKSVTATDGRTVIFELSKSDRYFENLLTFPIIKKDSDKLKNEDNVELAPIGSGKYRFSDSEQSLVANPYYRGEKISDKIILVDAPDLESVQHYVEIGATDFYHTDPSDGNIVRMSGQKASLNMNNLVYIGINHSYGALSSPLLRQTISSAINRELITESSYYGYATPANGFFHPEWNAVSGYQTLQSNSDTKISIENLEKIGYNNLDKDGFRKNSSGSYLSFSLLVNSSNKERAAAAQLVKEQLEEIGIKITLSLLPDSQYFDALAKGNFQLYIGELRLTSNMDISSLVVEGGSAAYGVKNTKPSQDNNGETVASASASQVISDYYSGKSTISEVATSLQSDMPVIPIAYRNSILFYSNNLAGQGESFRNNFFSSLRLTK